MPIRFATAADVPSLVDLGRRMHAITRFRRFEYQGERVARALHEAIERGGGRYACFVAEGSGGELAGALLAVLERPIFSEQLIASVMYFVVRPEKRMGGYAVRLLKAFERWARNRGVWEIAFGSNSGGEAERTEKFVDKMGFERVGMNFVKGCL